MLKLGRWFSWNASAEDNLDCVSGVRMILEDHVHGCSGPTVGDPDLSAIAFDDLHGIAAAKTPYAQIQQTLYNNSFDFENGELFVWVKV